MSAEAGPAPSGTSSGGHASGASASTASGIANDGGEEAGDTGEEISASSAVSLLQELVQSCSSFSPHTRILTWTFEKELQEDTSLRFCATVSFVFGNVPHSFCGGWQSSKKKAQRDAAERVRRYLQQRLQGAEGRELAHAAIDPSHLPEDVSRELLEVCRGRAVPGSTAGGEEERCTEWRFEDRGAGSLAGVEDTQWRFRAVLTFHAGAMPHYFAGSWLASEDEAQRDTAERVLWYFGRGSEPFVAILPSEGDANLPLPQLSSPSADNRSQQDIDDKTVLMSVQNTLQKAFASQTPPGQRVWLWGYEQDGRDPQLFRARVDVPCWGRSFFGAWCRGKKFAQRSACAVVRQHLGELPALGP